MSAEILVEALERVTIGSSREAVAYQLAAAIDEIGYTIRKKPRSRKAAPSPVEVPVFDTGDARIDAFMRRHHKPGRKLPAMPTVPGTASPTIYRSEAGRKFAEEWWAAECALAAEEQHDEAFQAPEEVLHAVIALHRTPWHREGPQRLGPSERGKARGTYLTFVSGRHPDVQIQRWEWDWGRAGCYRVVAEGRATEEHYSMSAAELAADRIQEMEDAK